MIGTEIGERSGEELVAFVRALGRHRYVAGRMHLVHAFAVEAATTGAAPAELLALRDQAAAVLADPGVDVASRDERLLLRATDAELGAVLAAFWTGGAEAPRARLRERLIAIDAPPPSPPPPPFDEDREEDVFPVLVDAGWELLPLADLDPERHAGAIGAIGDLEVARFEEENAVPRVVALQELPVLGATELLDAFDADGRSRAPFVLWSTGHDAYTDYVVRGALRAAKLA